MNYQIFYYFKYRCGVPDVVIIKDFVDQFLEGKISYQRYNDMTGCLIRCAKEVERRLGTNAHLLIEIMDSYDREIANYEDVKIRENTDV